MMQRIGAPPDPLFQRGGVDAAGKVAAAANQPGGADIVAGHSDDLPAGPPAGGGSRAPQPAHTGTGREKLAAAAGGKNCEINFDDDLHDMSLQGPVSVDLLAQEIPGIRDLAYFGLMQTRLYGRDVMISRTGYTGERGYEIFCRAKDAVHLWDSILEAGKDMGVRPVQFSTLDMLRIESYLLFYPGDNSETFPFENETCGDTLWELGLEFTVSPGKEGFVGSENHYASKGKERFKIYGVKLSGDEMTQMEMFARVHHDGKDVGVITYGLSSELYGYSVAIARLDPFVAKPGTVLTGVKPDGKALAATAEEMPLYDQIKWIRTVTVRDSRARG